jgi:hypothetical protein
LLLLSVMISADVADVAPLPTISSFAAGDVVPVPMPRFPIKWFFTLVPDG